MDVVPRVTSRLLLAHALLPLAVRPRRRCEPTSAELVGKSRIPEAHVFAGFGCSGGNVSPSLSWSNAPAGTKSFALTMYDPDAPTGSGWWHWVVYNMPATTTSLAAGVGTAQGNGLPAGAIQGRTDFGSTGYGGPCPPAGDRPHRYVFTIFALTVEKLELPESATAALIGFNVRANTLAKAEFTALYQR
jgi:Raf kinase inhibitor-like YbhB/YbcL family protein